MTRPTAIEFQAGQSKTRHGLIIGTLCASVGLAILLFAGESVPDRHWLGGLLVVIGAGVALYAWYTGQQAGTGLRIDENGVRLREWGLTVPWAVIEDVYQTGTRMQPFVTIKVRDAGAFLARLSQEEARGLRGNRLWKDPELRIPYNAVEATRDEMLDALQAGLSDYR